jgi:hypothetical protein
LTYLAGTIPIADEELGALQQRANGKIELPIHASKILTAWKVARFK